MKHLLVFVVTFLLYTTLGNPLNVSAYSDDDDGYNQRGERVENIRQPAQVYSTPDGGPQQYRAYNYSGANCDGYTVNYNPDSNIKLVFLGQYLQRFDINPSNYAKVHRLGCFLKSLDADYIFTDTEEAILAPLNSSTAASEFINNAVPSVAPTLVFDLLTKLYGITLVAVANNHVFDLGVDGFLYTLDQLKQRNVPYVGGGHNISEAVAPKILPLRNPYKKLAIHAVVSAPSLNIYGGKANSISPGVNHMQVDSQTNPRIVDSVAQQLQFDTIQAACQSSDIVVSYHHNHYNNRTNPFNRLAWETDYRQGTIDHGASFYVSHGAAVMLGVESYKGALIFHNLGSLVFQTTNGGYYVPDAFESVIGMVELDRDTTQIEAVTFWPVALNGPPEAGGQSNPTYWQALGFPGFLPTAGQPQNLFSPVEQGMAILYRFKAMSAELGTTIEIDDNSVTASIVFERKFQNTKPSRNLKCRRYHNDF